MHHALHAFGAGWNYVVGPHGAGWNRAIRVFGKFFGIW